MLSFIVLIIHSIAVLRTASFGLSSSRNFLKCAISISHPNIDSDSNANQRISTCSKVYATSLEFGESDSEEEVVFPPTISDEWEVDCYSRPVVTVDGKKLWELLVTDSNGDFKYLKTIPSNLVNSRNLRSIIEELMETSPVRPKLIRFFRTQMLNMLTIALSTLEVDVKPSRRTHNLLMWLKDRETNVYPYMTGYNPQLRQGNILDFEVSQPERLPDLLRAESYAFVALPAESFWNEEINADNINRGSLCPLQQLPKTGWVHGITLFSKRADSVAAWMQGLEIANLKVSCMFISVSASYIIEPTTSGSKLIQLILNCNV